MFLDFMTFQISVLFNFWSILILIFWGGAPLRALKKNVRKGTPMIPYNTQFLLKNLFCYQK